MKTIVTGGAGFIGSHLTERLAADGHEVAVVDCFTDYYDRHIKEANCERWAEMGVPLHELDLRDDDLAPVLDDVEVVFHLAAQPGVRRSWSDFASYAEHNLVATQQVFDASHRAGVRRVVAASSSSVYGNAKAYPTFEDDPLRPRSPYGMTKRAVEDLAATYADNWDLDTVLLRYFTVYGPRQRPDMAFHRLCEAAVRGTTFPLYGTGEAARSFTYVSDAVEATVLAATAPSSPGIPVNVSGGEMATVRQVIELLERLHAGPVPVEGLEPQAGDVTRTDGDTGRAESHLGYKAEVDLESGLGEQLEWHRHRPW